MFKLLIGIMFTAFSRLPFPERLTEELQSLDQKRILGLVPLGPGRRAPRRTFSEEHILSALTKEYGGEKFFKKINK